jgi:hypothetical protein
MKLESKMLVAVAMMVGALGATGCNKLSQQAEAVADEDNPAAAPVDEAADGQPGFEQNARRVRYYAPYAPPAARRETWGRPPSERHFWAPGYYRWSGREHVWVPGRWEARREHYDWRPAHWENRYGRWEYIPGHWVRTR